MPWSLGTIGSLWWWQIKKAVNASNHVLFKILVFINIIFNLHPHALISSWLSLQHEMGPGLSSNRRYSFLYWAIVLQFLQPSVFKSLTTPSIHLSLALSCPYFRPCSLHSSSLFILLHYITWPFDLNIIMLIILFSPFTALKNIESYILLSTHFLKLSKKKFTSYINSMFQKNTLIGYRYYRIYASIRRAFFSQISPSKSGCVLDSKAH